MSLFRFSTFKVLSFVVDRRRTAGAALKVGTLLADSAARGYLKASPPSYSPPFLQKSDKILAILLNLGFIA
jgi:hypothetical protein